MEDSSAWGMQTDGSGLFAEYLKLAQDAGWGELIDAEEKQIGKSDCLVVVDMQNDFIPVDEINPEGGAFGVADGARTSPLIVKLMDQFAAAGGMVVATRDYHPADHCSWLECGGPFPKHCMQGTVGSFFYKPIGEQLSRLRSLDRRAQVVFKGYHEDIDSFGSFEYDQEYASGRLKQREDEDRLYGCSICDWTGCVLLKCSNLAADANAPPDIMSVLGRKSLRDVLKSEGIDRVFACGLAMDFCVLDTCLNASKAGFREVFMIMDAARAARIPGIGQFGSGFLSDPAEIQGKLKDKHVKVIPTAALVPLNGATSSPQGALAMASIGKSFPEGLGPFALISAVDMVIQIDVQQGTWSASEPRAEIANLKQFGLSPMGQLAPITPITLQGKARADLSLPADAKSFAWAYPVGAGRMTDQQLGYFSLTTPSAALFMFGGFVYLDAKNNVKAVMALAIGEGLNFEAPKEWKNGYTVALRDRWQPATAPFLKAKGVKRFAWVNPKETLSSDSGGGDWEVCEHGAFAYRFNEDEASHAKDVFFAVSAHSTKSSANLGRLGSYAQVRPEPGQQPKAAARAWEPKAETTKGKGTSICAVQ